MEHAGSMITAALALVSFTATGLSLCPGGAPQVPDVVDVFFAAGADSDASVVVEGGVLLCRVDVVGDHGWDTFGAVDLAITLTIGKGAPAEVWGPEDRSSAVVSVPGVHLRPGQSVVIDVDDRDVTGREPITRGVARYTGTWPLRFDLRDVQVECRIIDHDVAVARAVPALTSARAALAQVAHVRPDLAADDLGAPRGAWFDADRHTAVAASWLGDDDAGVQSSREARAAAEQKFHEAARAAVVAAQATLPPPGGWIPMASLGVEARFVAGPSLVVEVRAPADGEPLPLRDVDVAAAIGLLDDGAAELVRGVRVVSTPRAKGARGLDPDGVAADEAPLAPGAVRRIRLQPLTGRSLPAVARVDGVVVRLR